MEGHRMVGARIAAVACALAFGSAAFGKGVLLLAFDDRGFEGWTNAIPLFAKYGGTASFFVSGPIDAPAAAAMKKLVEFGHVVGLHGLRHADADRMAAADPNGLEGWWEKDVQPQVDQCREAGIDIRHYAYPNCRRTEATDAFLFAKGMWRVRGGYPYAPYDPQHLKLAECKPIAKIDGAFFPARGCDKVRLMKGVIVGESYNTRIDDILECIRRAGRNDEVFQIISHEIAPDAHGINMKTEWLEAILKTAKENGLWMRNYDDLGGEWPSMRPPVTVTAGEGWVPMRDTLDVAKGSALDFTEFAGERVPAGTYGRVVAKGDRFEFENLPGVAQRFYGPNLCYSALYLPDEESTKLADLFQRMGYNAVRLHHQENALCTGDDGLTIVPERMAELDALAAKMIARGLYISTDLFVSREIAWRALGEDRDGKLSILDFSHAVAFKPRYEENLKAFARAWLTHVNPHTGRRWADEPALAFLSLVNENNPTPDDAFRKLVGAPGKDELPDADFPEWIAERIAAFDARMIRFLREEIGYRGLVTGLNNSYPRVRAYNRARKAYDYVDGHVYAYHPQFLNRAWRLPSAITQYDPLALRNGCSRWDADYCVARDPSKPYVVSEFNFAVPAEYRCFGGLIFGAGCAANGHAAIWRFAWSHSRASALEPGPLNYFDLSRDPIGRANERALLALFLRGDQPADRSVTIAEGPVFSVNTPRTRGELVSGTPSALFSISLDGHPIETSRRILVTHLTDVRDTGMTFREKDFRTLMKWGRLPHLMRAESREVALPLACTGCPVRRRVFALNADGSRRFEVPHATEGKTLLFTADVAADPNDATYLYEVVAEQDDACGV